MTSESVQDAVNEIRDARAQVESMISGNSSKVQQLEIQVSALKAELEAVNAYYSGINNLLDRLSEVKGAQQQQRIAVQILDLRNRKKSLKKVERSSE